MVKLVNGVHNEKKLVTLESALAQVNNKIQTIYQTHSTQKLKREQLIASAGSSEELEA